MQLARANGKILIHDNGSFYEALGITGDIDTFGVGAALDQLSSITKGALVDTDSPRSTIATSRTALCSGSQLSQPRSRDGPAIADDSNGLHEVPFMHW